MNSPIFIVGFHRSGTTLLRLVLNAHSQIMIPAETHVIVKLHARLGAQPDPDAFIKALFSDKRFQRIWQCDHDVLRKALERSPADLGKLFHTSFQFLASSQGKARWGEKTPNNVRYITTIARLFPDARFVHIIRDGRDIACSLKTVGWYNRALPRMALSWRKVVTRGRRQGRRLGDRRYCEVRYEDLVHNPEQQLKVICRFAEIEFEPGMIQFYSDTDRQFTTTNPKDFTKADSPIYASSVGRWARELTPDEACVFELISGPSLACFRYDVSSTIIQRLASARYIPFMRRFSLNQD